MTGVPLLPMSEILSRLDELPTDRPLAILCRSGARSGAGGRVPRRQRGPRRGGERRGRHHRVGRRGPPLRGGAAALAVEGEDLRAGAADDPVAAVELRLVEGGVGCRQEGGGRAPAVPRRGDADAHRDALARPPPCGRSPPSARRAPRRARRRCRSRPSGPRTRRLRAARSRRRRGWRRAATRPRSAGRRPPPDARAGR